MDVYSFDLTLVVPNDIVYGNPFTSTHPASFFTSARVAVRSYPDGQATLFNFRCTTTRQDTEVIEQLPNDEHYIFELRTRFGIDLDVDYEDLTPLDGSA